MHKKRIFAVLLAAVALYSAFIYASAADVVQKDGLVYIPDHSVFFADVDEHYAWAVQPVDYLANHKVISGTADCVYSPERALSRADFVTMLTRAYDMNDYVGGGSFSVIAGPCSVESEEQICAVAEDVKSSGAALLRGVLCNFLVCIAVWMSQVGESAAEKFIGLYGPIFVFVLCGFEHSIANMFYLPAGIFLGANVGWGGFLLSNLLPVTLGNIVGGCLVGIVYRAVYLKKKG